MSAVRRMFRLTPAERLRAVTALLASLGRDQNAPAQGGPDGRTTARCYRLYNERETTLVGCVEYGPRGWSMALTEEKAAELAAELHLAGAHDLAERCRHHWQPAVQSISSGRWRRARSGEIHDRRRRGIPL